MDVQVVESGPCRRTLTIKVPPERIRSQLEQMFQAAAGQVRMKGFRSGKVPRKVLEKKFGDSIRADAKERIVNESFREALESKELRMVGEPEVEGIDETPIDPTATLEFTVHVDIAPQFELKEVEGVEIDAQPTEVTDDDVEQAIGQLADQKRTLDPVDSPIEENDFLKASLRFLDADGNVVLERDSAQVSPNIPLAGSDPEAFKASLIGKEKGDEVEITLTFPDNFEKEELRGQPGKAAMTIQEVQRVQRAPIDDELAKGFEFDSLDALRTELRKRIGEEKERSEIARREERILEILANDHPFALPLSMVEDQLKHSLEGFRKRLEEAQMPPEQIEERLAGAQEEARADAERRVRMFFLLNEIARQKEIRVTEADLRAEMQALAAQHGVGLDQVQEHFKDRGRLTDLHLGIMERKVREFLREHAKISDKRTG